MAGTFRRVVFQPLEIFVCLLLAGNLTARSADAVTLRLDKHTATASNALVSATFDSEGRLRKLSRTGAGELLGNGGQGYFDLTTEAGGTSISLSKSTRSVVRATPELVEISYAKEWDAGEIDFRYVLRAGDAGLYFYVVHRHAADQKPGAVAQKRYVLRADPKQFTYAVTSKERHGPMPTPRQLAESEEITDATYRLRDGSVYTKYEWADFQDGHWGHGLCSSNAGLWLLFGSTEYLMGGPTKQELMVHQTDTTPVLLAMLTGSHFLGEQAEQKITGDWAMLYGPVFIYANLANSPARQFADAATTARALDRAWPYSWMDHPLYPPWRGTVSGRLNISWASASNATVVLAAPDGDWQMQWKQPVYSTHADASGRFTIRNVAPGSYTLHSFASGTFGEFTRKEIVVRGGIATDLGELTWMPKTNGRLLWQIGTPDRTAAEFRHGDEPRTFGLLGKFTNDFPNGVDFVIGRSREAVDWNYAQPSPRSRDATPWNIRFNLDAAPAGSATLTLAIAGSDGGGRLRVKLNGVEAGIIPIEDNGCIRRAANRAGHFRQHEITFLAKLLRAGENVMELVVDRRGSAVMYDALKLELALDTR